MGEARAGTRDGIARVRKHPGAVAQSRLIIAEITGELACGKPSGHYENRFGRFAGLIAPRRAPAGIQHQENHGHLQDLSGAGQQNLVDAART